MQLFIDASPTLPYDVTALEDDLRAALGVNFTSLARSDYSMVNPETRALTGRLQWVITTTHALTDSEQTAVRAILTTHDPAAPSPLETRLTNARRALRKPGVLAAVGYLQDINAASTFAGAKPALVLLLWWVLRNLVRVMVALDLTDEDEPNGA